jgi:hypothetical protein
MTSLKSKKAVKAGAVAVKKEELMEKEVNKAKEKLSPACVDALKTWADHGHSTVTAAEKQEVMEMFDCIVRAQIRAREEKITRGKRKRPDGEDDAEFYASLSLRLTAFATCYTAGDSEISREGYIRELSEQLGEKRVAHLCDTMQLGGCAVNGYHGLIVGRDNINNTKVIASE